MLAVGQWPATWTPPRSRSRIKDRYRIDVLDTSTGRALGRIARNIAVRATPEALKPGMRAALAATPGMETASLTMASSCSANAVEHVPGVRGPEHPLQYPA